MAGKPDEELDFSKLFTVINTFTLKDPAQDKEFERRFLDHVEWMRRQEGFGSHQAVRLVERPGVYVNLGWWLAPEAFQNVLRSETFQAHAKEFHELVDVTADPSNNVLRINATETAGDRSEFTSPIIVIEHLTTEADAAEFEGTYQAYADFVKAQYGFGYSDLSRSLVRPGAYTATTWWWSEEAYLAVQESKEFTAVKAAAEVRPERAAHLAWNRAATAEEIAASAA
ncbi:antibiotic biosynthesis monooxygenase (plasmid) [Streptomyces sp. NBC_00435]|uniref:antibiotic biosynthesis monooxygenase family protein n=1 Tax=Streptomyces sp. NBC_00435 TaxID=2903649 RepID=UPI002E1A7828